MIPGPAHSQTSIGSRRLWSAPEHPAVPGVGGLGPAGPRRLVQRASFVATARLHGVAPGCTQRHTQPADVAACRFVPRPHETGSRPAGEARVKLGCRTVRSRSCRPTPWSGHARKPGPTPAGAARPRTQVPASPPTRPPRTPAPTGAPGGVAGLAAEVARAGVAGSRPGSGLRGSKNGVAGPGADGEASYPG